MIIRDGAYLVQDASVFLVYADGRFDRLDTTGPGAKVGIEIRDTAQAVASESKRVCQRANAVSFSQYPLCSKYKALVDLLSSVESMFPLVREGSLAIWHNYKSAI